MSFVKIGGPRFSVKLGLAAKISRGGQSILLHRFDSTKTVSPQH